ncbi:hypothetical protein IV203_028722 [Nitzschia inconspicua]|uniref:Uncharacterized protein n=1 Tax=Nitzschia inconspicua TaxID=303405 RepID=A0A9K3LPN4_9STRA|nr:hypothetical protein IV203_028722 [Nitzschia inconspicua]
MENIIKKKKFTHPALDEVHPLKVAEPGIPQVLPTFLHNLLFSPATKVPYDACPFSYYFNLGGPAWDKKDESQHLIERPCYKTLTIFLDRWFASFQLGTQQRAVVTGTAGIGKTFFALYAARVYFRRGEFVVLYHRNRAWAFSNKDPKEFLIRRGAAPIMSLKKLKRPNGQDFWYQEIKEGEPEFLRILSEWENCGCAFFIRDPGEEKALLPLDSLGRELYTVSSGQEDFLAILRKSRTPVEKYLRTGALWDGEEFLYGVKLGLLWSDSHELDLDYIMEGYRRYGGSARSALRFAEKLRDEKIGKEDIQKQPLEATTIEAIAKIAEQQVMGQTEMTKAKSLLFHRTPVGNSFRIHFSSPYLGHLLMKRVRLEGSKALTTVIAALSVGGGYQDAFGTLYEEEVHKKLYQEASVSKQAILLGCHKPSKKRMKGKIIAKDRVSLELARISILSFPGNSLDVVRLEDYDPLETYFHPLTSNFPTHDSFIMCQASTFFSATEKDITKKEKSKIEKSIATSIVLVGLQMTVSGSDKLGDKPSHTVYGSHLANSLKAIKTCIEASGLKVNIFEDVVTIFLSPAESCCKMKYMPVLTAGGKELEQSIVNMEGIAPQYYAICEAKMIENLMEKTKKA